MYERIVVSKIKDKNPCAEVSCEECCHDMAIPMKLIQFWRYIGGNLNMCWPIYYGSFRSLSNAVNNGTFTLEAPVVYGSRHALHKIPNEELSTYVYKHRDSEVLVVINGKCRNLFNGYCTIYKDPYKPESCSSLTFKGPKCAQIRKDRNHPSIISALEIPVVTSMD